VSNATATPRDGVVYGLIAYVMWGFFPLYWALLRGTPATEVLGHRIVGTFVFLLGLLVVTGGLRAVWSLSGRQWALLGAAGALVSVNWLVYIWAVQNAHVVETSLGYFINPLVTVALGVLVLGERLRHAQIAALVIASVAVLAITLELGHPPFIALTLAFTFAAYGLLKKRVGAPPMLSVWIETAYVVVPAAGWLLHLHGAGVDTFGRGPLRHDLLMLGAGVVTPLPLLAFAAAANRVPLTVLGLLQYVSPVLQFLCGVAILGEAMSGARWAGFGLVWVALIVFTVDGLRSRAPSPIAHDES